MYTKEMVYQVPINLGGHIFPTTMIILKDQDIDVILGMNWMYQHKVVIYALNRTIRVSLPDSTSHPTSNLKKISEQSLCNCCQGD